MTAALVNILADIPSFPTPPWPIILIGTMEYTPAITLVPRFILSLRKLYAHDLRSRRGSEIDAAVGLSSADGRGAVASAIVFALNAG